MVGQLFQRELGVLEHRGVDRQPLGLHQRQELLAGLVLASSVRAVHVVDAGRDAHVDLEGGALGFVLLAGAAWVLEQGPMNLRPACSMARTNSSSSAMKP